MALIAQDEGRGAFLRVAPAPPDEDEAAQQREVGRGVASAGAGFVLEPGGVAGMVVFVFDAPPGADGDQGVSWGEGLAEDEDPPAGAGFAGGLVGAVAFDFEELRGVDEAELFRGNGEGAVVALVDPAVTRFEGRCRRNVPDRRRSPPGVAAPPCAAASAPGAPPRPGPTPD